MKTQSKLTTSKSTQIDPQFRTIDGLTIRFAESDERDDHALLLSPWPESIYAYESTWSSLAAKMHLVAIDLPGFGRSERRDSLLTPREMGEFVIRIADAFELENPHVVGPDVGTSAALFAAAKNPGRLRSLTVGSGGAEYPLNLGGVLRDWVETPDLEGIRNTDPREIVGAAIASLEKYKPSDTAVKDYLESYEGDRFVESTRYVRSYPIELKVLGEELPNLKTPVQIIAGESDIFVPPRNAEYLHERLPHSRLDVLRAGHFFWEDGNDEFVAAVTDWWNAGYKRFSLEVSSVNTI